MIFFMLLGGVRDYVNKAMLNANKLPLKTVCIQLKMSVIELLHKRSASYKSISALDFTHFYFPSQLIFFFC